MRLLSTRECTGEGVTDRSGTAQQRFGHAPFSSCREWRAESSGLPSFLLVRDTFPGRGRRPGGEMSSSEASVLTPARGGASPADAGASLAGLIGVLDRADGVPSVQRSRPVHTAAFRASARAVPLRPVLQAPAARPGRVPVPAPRTPTVTVVPEPERRPITGLRDLARRAALWGAGPQGEYAAWRTPDP